MADTIEFAGYTFDNVQAINDNFGDILRATERVIGVDGGFDSRGFGRGWGPVGLVTVTFEIISYTANEMYSKRDAVRALATKKKQKLKWTPDGGTERFCFARARVPDVPVNLATLPNLKQVLQVEFEVDDPHWYQVLDGTFVFGTSQFGGSDVLGGGTSSAVTGSGDIPITANGNARTLPIISLKCGAGQQVSVPRFSIKQDGLIDAAIQFDGTLQAGDLLVIDCRRRRATLNSVAVYDKISHPKQRAYWGRLMPGANTISVKFATGTDAGTVSVSYWEAFK